MPKLAESLIGKTFGELTVIEKIPDDTRRKRYDRWLCECSCGNKIRARGFYLKGGIKKDCGDIMHCGNKGGKFGRLTVMPGEVKIVNRKKNYLCKCDCGKMVYVNKSKLVSGHTKSCGCYAKETIQKSSITHGMTYSRLYRIWCGILSRCECPGDGETYIRYGARGIKVCEAWHKFETFRDWAISSGYSENLSIERINNDGNYCPENCRWATNKEQANNRRNSLWIEYMGEKKTLAQWAEQYNIPYQTLYYRYVYGKWDIKSALTKPLKK